MKTAKSIILLLALSATNLVVDAQAPRNSYFMENIPLRHTLNPAFAPDFGYVALPAIGGIAVGANGNIGIDNFLFTRNGETVTGLNRQVSNDEFLDGLKSKNYVEINTVTNLLSVGFKAMGGFNTIGLSLHTAASVDIPRQLFEFAKAGQTNEDGNDYDIRNLRLKSSNYVELAIGHSRLVGEKVRIGAKLKYLAGIAYVDADVNNLDIKTSADRWSVREQGRLFVSKAINIAYKPNGEIDDINTDSFGIQGNGFGADLGFSILLNKHFSLSASLTDLGFISWSGSNSTLNPDEFVYDGFHHIGAEKDDSGESDLSRECDQLEEDLRQLVRFNNEENVTKTQSLASTLTLAGEYRTANDKIGVGLLYSTRFAGKTWTELMASANFRPMRWFNAAVNFSTSNLGHSFGALLNFCPRGFNFYLGTDYIPIKYTKEGIPAGTAKFNFTLGMAITFGHNSKS